MKSKGNKDSKFKQCLNCKVFLLSQTAVRKHTKDCTNSKGHRKSQASTLTSVSLPLASIPLTRICSQENDTPTPIFPKNAIRKRGRSSKNHGSDVIIPRLHAPVVTQNSLHPRCNVKKRGHVGGMVEGLNISGLTRLEHGKRTASASQKSSVVAKKKGHTICDFEGNDSLSNPENQNRMSERLLHVRPEDADAHIPSDDYDEEEKLDTEGASKRQKVQCADAMYIHKCSQCTAKFSHVKFLAHHIKMHTAATTTHTCPICARMFGIRGHYRMHLRWHVDAEKIENTFNLWEKWPTRTGGKLTGCKNQLPCKFCLIPHPTHDSFLLHMKNQHPDRTKDSKFSCPYSCDEISDSILGFTKHIKKKHREKNHNVSKRERLQCVDTDTLYIHKCSHCTAKFTQEKFLTRHIKMHTLATITYSCPVCARMFGILGHYRMHLRWHMDAEEVENTFNPWEKWPTSTGGKLKGSQHELTCKFCLIPHPTHNSFLLHMKNQHPDKTKDSKFPCPYSCDEIADSISAFVNHIKENHRDKYYHKATRRLSRDQSQPKKKYVYRSKCDICNKTVSAGYLKSHKKKHEQNALNSKKKPFCCYICHFRFAFRHNLRRHFVLHLENNPFVCHFPDCGIKFQDMYHLESHVELHFSELITCDKCDITYKETKRGKHTCVFDESKIIVDEDGRKYLKQQRKSMLKATGLEAFVSKTGSFQSTVQEKGGNVIIKQERMDDIRRFEVESVHFIDKIIETEEDAIHIKGEQLSPVRSETEEDKNADLVKIQNQKTTRGGVSILQLITEDPVYQRLIQEKPEFAEMIMGVNGENRVSFRNKTFDCPNCDASFLRSFRLEQHKKKCIKDDDVCDDTQDVSSKKEPPVTLMCASCGYQTLTKEDLHHHMKTAMNHGSGVKFFCSYPGCGYPFSTSEGLKAHFHRIHLAEKKFVCEHEKCDKAFTTQENLRTHMQKFHGICPVVRRHIEEGGGKITFKCLKCAEVFDDGTLFASHRRKHYYYTSRVMKRKRTPRVKCQICADDFADRRCLKRHIMLVHTKSMTCKQYKSRKIPGKRTCSEQEGPVLMQAEHNGVGNANDTVDNCDTGLILGL